ncbi:heterokaryon incompatibility [Diplodia corticola]|uniref:Heterokaryon incompatibility n=1 Tax=Diplodia corticola TaxID=236234 RepID=A0A1J9S872_9PEZI|nr:heterokaryon incompatibility [Diplodia corticola]OJD36695.1 heterokaryon incompatibility [Diplodia corticola]
MDSPTISLSEDCSSSDSDDGPTPQDDCSFCTQFLDGSSEEDQRAIHRMFHEECGACLPSASSEQRLCSFCRHLRIRHQSICYRPKYPLPIPLGPIEDLEAREGSCSFCRLLLRAVRKFAKENGSDWVSAKVMFKPLGDQPFLEWNDYSGAPGQSAYCDILCFDGDVQRKPQLSIQDSAAATGVPLGPAITDWKTIKERFQHCLQEHPECDGRPDTLPNGFRVIDVKRRRIVAAPTKCKYVALSYVWGVNPQPSMLLALRSTIGAYQEDGGLAASNMPKTIEDAMLACTQLGIDYLWADRLCIIQDDPEDKLQQIMAMSGIYTLASLVIIAVDGDNMDTGLAGISRTRPAQPQDTVEDLRVAPVLPTYHEMADRSVWFSRGWTYQEAILANRKLYFTNAQVCYECEHQLWHEDPLSFGRGNLNKMSPQYQSPAFTMGLYGGRGTRFEEYVRHLSPYRTRALTNQSDVYNAFTGILNALYGTEEVLFGLPRPAFDQALLWRPYSIQDKVKPVKPYLNKIANMVLPSWSWGSVVGIPGLSPFSFQGTLVSWHMYSEAKGREGMQRIEACESPPSWNDDHAWNTDEDLVCPQLHMALAWMEGCVEAALPDSIPFWRETTFSDLVPKLESLWPTYERYWNDVSTSSSNAKRIDGESNARPGVLHGRVQTASFRVRLLELYSDTNLSVVDDADDIIGIVRVQDPLVELEVLRDVAKDRNTKFEFIALAVSKEPDLVYWMDSEMTDWDQLLEKRPDLTFYDRDGKSPANVPTVNVMLVGRRGEVAYRISTGWICLSKWVKARPQFQDVMLE